MTKVGYAQSLNSWTGLDTKTPEESSRLCQSTAELFAQAYAYTEKVTSSVQLVADTVHLYCNKLDCYSSNDIYYSCD